MLRVLLKCRKSTFSFKGIFTDEELKEELEEYLRPVGSGDLSAVTLYGFDLLFLSKLKP